ncbi:Protein of unknown function DUF3106 [Burkholderiaceae bacterium]|jgi:hypothetical protein
MYKLCFLFSISLVLAQPAMQVKAQTATSQETPASTASSTTVPAAPPLINPTAPLTASPSAHGKASTKPPADKKSIANWVNLNPAQQQILAPLEGDWSSMAIESRQKWVKLANIYPKIAATEQERLQTRMLEWSKLSQKDRRLARENYLSSLKFPNDKKNEAWQAYQQLTDEEKQKLAARENSQKKPSTATSPSLQTYPASK